MLLNVKDVKSILKTLDIDSNSFFKKINLHLDQIQEKLIGIHFYRVMDIETGKYHFYRLNTTTNETIEYNFEHTWLRECLKEAKNKVHGKEDDVRKLLIQNYHNLWNQRIVDDKGKDDWCVKTYQRIAGLSKKRMELKELKEYFKKNHE